MFEMEAWVDCKENKINKSNGAARYNNSNKITAACLPFAWRGILPTVQQIDIWLGTG